VSAPLILRLAILGLVLSGCGGDDSDDNNLAPVGSQAYCPEICTPETGPCPSGLRCWASLQTTEDSLCCDDRPLESFVPVLPFGQNAQCRGPCSLEDAECRGLPSGFECWSMPGTTEFACCDGRLTR
jgi:hypothetical protein